MRNKINPIPTVKHSTMYVKIDINTNIVSIIILNIDILTPIG